MIQQGKWIKNADGTESTESTINQQHFVRSTERDNVKYKRSR